MLWNGRTLSLNATLINARDHGNLTFEVGGEQINVPHRALIAQGVIDAANAAHAVLDNDWLEAQCPLSKEMSLPATIVSVRDLSNVVVTIGRSSEGRQVRLDQRIIHEAAGLGAEPLGATKDGEAPAPTRGRRP